MQTSYQTDNSMNKIDSFNKLFFLIENLELER